MLVLTLLVLLGLSGLLVFVLSRKLKAQKRLLDLFRKGEARSQEELSHKEKLAQSTMEELKGTPVMAISNEDEAPIFGVYMGTEVWQHPSGGISRHHQVLGQDGQTYGIGGVIIPTEHKELVDFLMSLPSENQYLNGGKRPGKRWEILLSMTMLRQDLDLIYKHLPKAP